MEMYGNGFYSNQIAQYSDNLAEKILGGISTKYAQKWAAVSPIL